MNIPASGTDPRYYQIGVLSLLVAYGIAVLDFGIHWQHALGILSTALAVQLACTRHARLPRFDPLSPLITSLSLTLLLRTDSLLLACSAAVIAIGSKFFVRINGKHVFNPANIAIVVLVLASDRAWISTGQWGSTTIVALALAGLGMLVLSRARRAETTIVFLFSYASILIGRTIWLGDPLSIPIHYLQNGALLIFAFFMISDPKTTPDTALGRSLFAVIVATCAIVIQFCWYEPNGPILALALSAPLVRLIDIVSRGRHYAWRTARTDVALRPLSVQVNSKE